MRHAPTFTFLFALSLASVCLSDDGSGEKSEPHDSLGQAIEQLKASADVWRANDEEFRALRKTKQASEAEVLDFAGFVAGLKLQVLVNCENVRKLGGDAVMHCADCEILHEEASAAAAFAAVEEPSLTREEEAAKLAMELRKLEAELDGLIMSGQDKLRDRESGGLSNGSWAGGPGKDSGAASEGSGGPAGGLGGAKGLGGDSHEPGHGPGVDKEGESPEFRAGKAGDGRDDDVVARQLREAAEMETDPVLKEQLWKEYRKYKSGLSE